MIFCIYLFIIMIVIVARLNFLRGRHMHRRGQGDTAYYTDFNDSQSRLTLHYGLEQTAGLPFIITTEKWYHSTLKALGLSMELRTGFRNFDDRYFIITDTPAHLREILTNHELRKKINTLFQMPVRALYSSPTRLWFRVNRVGVYQELKNRTATQEIVNLETLEILRDIRTALAKHPAPYRLKNGRSARMKAFAFIAAHACFFGIAVLGGFPIIMDSAITLEFEELKSDALFVGALIACSWFGLITAIIGGRAWFGWVIADFVVFGIIGILLTTGFVMREANIRLDYSAPVLQKVDVSAKSCTLECYKRRRGRSSYDLDMHDCMSEDQTIAKYSQNDYKCRRGRREIVRNFYLSWYGERNYLTKNVSAADYRRYDVGMSYVVPVHNGLFGYEWVDPDEFTPHQKTP